MAAVIFSAAARGDVLSQYSFTDVVPMQLNRDATTVAPNVMAGTITDAPEVPPGLNPPHNMVVLARSVDIGYASQPTLAASRGAWNEANDIANVYFSFDIAPASGYQLDLTTLTFNVSRGGAATPRVYDVRSSADGFATSLVSGPVEILTQRPTWTPVSVDLSGAAFQDLTSPVTFRMHYLGTFGQFGQNIDYDDITVNGTVVPVVVGLTGDYNEDDKVDAADYVVWRKAESQGVADLPNDNDDPGNVGAAEFNLWRANFGAMAGEGGGSASNGAIPEPATWLLAVIAMAVVGLRRRH
jgi:hypothetical protein